MKTKILLIVAITITIVTLMGIKSIFFKENGNLIIPRLDKTGGEVLSTPTPNPTPKSFQFGSSSNLTQELETINPQVLESDFDSLESLIKNF